MHFRSNASELNTDFFSRYEISSKKCVAHLKLNLLCSRMNAKDFLPKCRKFVYCVATDFAGKLLVTQFCKVCNCVFRSNIFSEKCFSSQLLLNFVVIFSVAGQLPAWTRSRNTQSRMDTIPNGHHPEWTRFQMDTIPNGHNPECTQSRMDTTPNGHNPEWTKSRMDTIPNGHDLE